MLNYEEIKDDEKTIAIIIRKDYSPKGYNFFTPKEYSQQLAYIQHPKGKQIQSHVHNIVKREVSITQETVFIKKGSLRTDFYTNEHTFLCSRTLHTGDLVFLAAGGHGFEVLEEVEMIVIKQGPYEDVEKDKTRFKDSERGAP
jgi:hypothetical protein